MVPHTKLINAVRSKGYAFKRKTERVEVYKLKGSTKRVVVQANRTHDPKYARATLRLAGWTDPEIEKFLAECDEQTRH